MIGTTRYWMPLADGMYFNASRPSASSRFAAAYAQFMERFFARVSSFTMVEDRVETNLTVYTSGRFTVLPSKPVGHARINGWPNPQSLSRVAMRLSFCFALKF